MFRFATEAAAADEPAEAVYSPRRYWYVVLRCAVVTRLHDAAVIAVVFESNLKRLLSAVRIYLRPGHVGPGYISGEPLVPMSVVIPFEMAVGDQVPGGFRDDGERRRTNYRSPVNCTDPVN